MFDAGTLTFQEFAMAEELPLAAIQRAILEFLRGRSDAAVFGAQAVNAYVSEPRMTQDVDVLTVEAKGLAEDLRQFLSDRFHIAVRARAVSRQRGFRVYQLRKPENRHLADIRAVKQLPATKEVDEVQIVSPEELIAGKVISYFNRQGQPKAWSDRRDLAVLLLEFPALKQETGPVLGILQERCVDPAIVQTWHELVKQEIKPSKEDSDFDW